MERIYLGVQGSREPDPRSEDAKAPVSKPMTEPTVPGDVFEDPLEKPANPGLPIVSTPVE